MKERTLADKIGPWLDVEGRREGWLGFVLMRLTGIGLVLYLVLHLFMLRLLLLGPESYDAFIALTRRPIVTLLDGVLIFGLSYHALNGIRVVVLGLGYAVDRQAELFWGSFILAVALATVATAAIIAG